MSLRRNVILFIIRVQNDLRADDFFFISNKTVILRARHLERHPFTSLLNLEKQHYIKTTRSCRVTILAVVNAVPDAMRPPTCSGMVASVFQCFCIG